MGGGIEETLTQAIECFATQQIDAAEILLRRAILENGPDKQLMSVMASVLHNRAVTAVDVGNLAQAESLLREAVNIAEAPVERREDLAKVLLRRALEAKSPGESEAAARMVAEAVGLWPAFQPSDMFAPLSQMLMMHAVSMNAADPYTAAVIALAAWVLRPQDPDAASNVWAMLTQLGSASNHQAADAQICDAVLKDRPDDYVALVGLGNALRFAGRLSHAETLYRRAMALRPEWYFAGSRLACVLTDQKRFVEANEMLRQAARVSRGYEGMVCLDETFVSGLRRPSPAQSKVDESSAEFELVVAAACDGRYFLKYSEALFRSIAKNCQGKVAVHVHLVDADAAAYAHAEGLRRAVPELPLFITSEESDPKFDDVTRRTYYSCARFLRLPAMLRHYRCPVLVLDIDLVVLRDVAPLVAQLIRERADVALVHGSLRDPWCALWADIVLAAPTPSALDYFDLVGAYIEYQFLTANARWFIDQVALFASMAVGYRDKVAPSFLALPMDIQNSHEGVAYFWSLHQSTPGNDAVLDSPLYQSFLASR